MTVADVTAAALVVLAYVLVVGGVGQVVDGGGAKTVLAVAATALVAVEFRPVRHRVRRLFDRIAYDRRATPHDVLSEFSRRMATSDTLLDRAARSLVEGTVADRVDISVRVDGRMIEAAAWGAAPSGDGSAVSLPVGHEGSELGVLTLSMRSGQQLPEQDELLARRVASGMGLAIANRVRTEMLRSRVEELRRSRGRLVARLDDTRRQLERDLHDGAQQQLVALKVKLALARTMSDRDGATVTAARLDDLTAAADATVDAMRDFARGLYPPLLEAEGLGPAVNALARRLRIPVTVKADRVGRFDQHVEIAVNLCIVEALANVVRHAMADGALVAVEHHDETLSFSVSDDGVGFDLDARPLGPGLTNLADRIDSVGGTFKITSACGGGTTVSGTVPVRGVAPS